jgi:hypothetical protein
VEYLNLLGMTEDELIQHLCIYEPELRYAIVYTADPYAKECNTEKRVMRIKKTNYHVEILVGYFSLPDFTLG